jgi:ribosomal protein S6--L-glutamate ligase
MKIAILSRSPEAYSTVRLREAADRRGHRVRVLDTFKFGISLETEYPDLYYAGKPLEPRDAVIPRIGASVTYFGTAVVRQFEQMGVFSVNTALGITNSRDKLRSLQILSKHEVGIPATAFVRARSDVLPAIERVGGTPVIIKLLEGTQGVGVILAETEKMAETIFETLQSARQNVLIQKFVAESKGRDVRAFVVGDRVVAAMRRVAQGGEFRSNVHRGGRTETVELDPAYERTAVRAAHILGLRVAGVDMLEGHDGPQIMEVNSSPGLEGIEKATGVDVAGAVVEFIEEHVQFPELDLRERLTLSRGYGVVEVHIPSGSPFVGKSLAESGLRERDIMVLRMSRGTGFITNPKSTRVVEADDTLLCFGKLAALRELPLVRKRRKERSGSAAGVRE